MLFGYNEDDVDIITILYLPASAQEHNTKLPDSCVFNLIEILEDKFHISYLSTSMNLKTNRMG